MRELGEQSARDEAEFYGAWEKKLPKAGKMSAGFRAHWNKKNSAFGSSADM
jgi:hypothetical protein